MTTPNQLATLPAPGVQLISSLEDMERVSKTIAASGLFGFTKPEQAFCLLLLSQAEGINPALALRQFHLIDGKFSMRADAMQGKFEASGCGILWHTRTDRECAATFYADKRKMDDKAVERAKARYNAMRDGDHKTASEYAWPGEETIIRTIEDAMEKGIASTYEKIDGKMTRLPDGTYKKTLKANWAQSTRQMLTARCVTEGVRLMAPGLIAGIVSEDEARDIADQKTERTYQVERNSDASDRSAMESIMQQHLDDAEVSKTDSEKKRLQGLAADMRCRIADLDLKPDAPKTIEAQAEIVQHAENEEPEQPASDPVPGPHPKAEPPPKRPVAEATTDWRTVDFSHKSPKVGSLLDGKTVGDIYASEPGTIARAKKILGGFMQTMDEVAKQIEKGATVAFAPADMRLYTALCEAERWLANQPPK